MAYDLFLKGSDLLHRGGRANLEQGISYFKKAIKEDPQFALAYAVSAIAYYYLDLFQERKIYTTEMGFYADKALLCDPLLPESLIAKALFYAHKKDYRAAIPYLEKPWNTILIPFWPSTFYQIFIIILFPIPASTSSMRF